MSSMIRRILRFLFITLPLVLYNGLCLTLFVVLLIPGFLRFAWYYFVVANRQVVRYASDSCRQALDIYTVVEEQSPQQRRQRQQQRESESRFSNEENSEEGEESRPPPGYQEQHQEQQLRPVLVFFSGGAWLIGYKMWGALLARCLTAAGIVVVIPDYRNYPWASVPSMVQDVESALIWVKQNVHDYGGDPNNIVLAGQSAGGHLIMTALLRYQFQQYYNNNSSSSQEEEPEVLKEKEHIASARTEETADDSLLVLNESTSLSINGSPIPASPPADELHQPESQQRRPSLTQPLLRLEASDFKGLITLSAPYNLQAMQETFTKHGMEEHLVDRIFGGQKDDYDPLKILQKIKDCSRTATEASTPRALREISGEPGTQPQRLGDSEIPLLSLPPVRVYHGDLDRTVPYDGSVVFFNHLTEMMGAGSVEFYSYRGWSHTDAILEGPMQADHRFHRDVCESIQSWTTTPATATPSTPVRGNNNDGGNDTTESSGPLASSAANTSLLVSWPAEEDPILKPLCPKCLVKAGSYFMPF